MPAPAFSDGFEGRRTPRVVSMLGVEGSGRCTNSGTSAGLRIRNGMGLRVWYPRSPHHFLSKYWDVARPKYLPGSGRCLDSNMHILWSGAPRGPGTLTSDFFVSEKNLSYS